MRSPSLLSDISNDKKQVRRRSVALRFRMSRISAIMIAVVVGGRAGTNVIADIIGL